MTLEGKQFFRTLDTLKSVFNAFRRKPLFGSPVTGGPSELFRGSKLVLNVRNRPQPPLESLLVCGDIRLIQQQNGNVSRRRRAQIKQLA